MRNDQGGRRYVIEPHVNNAVGMGGLYGPGLPAAGDAGRQNQSVNAVRQSDRGIYGGKGSHAGSHQP